MYFFNSANALYRYTPRSLCGSPTGVILASGCVFRSATRFSPFDILGVAALKYNSISQALYPGQRAPRCTVLAIVLWLFGGL